MASHPDGVRIGIALNEVNDPLVSLFVVQGGVEVDEFMFTEQETRGLLAVIQDGLNRAVVLREMVTMFPDQMDDIIANVMFRWSGTNNGA